MPELVPEESRQNPFAIIWKELNSLDRFTKLFLVISFLVAACVPFTTTLIFDTRQNAAGPQVEASPKNPIMWVKDNASLKSDDFYILINGKKFLSVNDNTLLISSSATYPPNFDSTTMEGEWIENNSRMRIYFYFKKTGQHWDVSEVRTYDGNIPGDWLYYPGFSGADVGQTLVKPTLDLVSNDGKGTIHFENLQLSAFNVLIPQTGYFLVKGSDSLIQPIINQPYIVPVYMLKDGVLISNQSGWTYDWTLDDPTVATIVPFLYCESGLIQNPCPPTRITIHPLKEGTAQINVSVKDPNHVEVGHATFTVSPRFLIPDPIPTTPTPVIPTVTPTSEPTPNPSPTITPIPGISFVKTIATSSLSRSGNNSITISQTGVKPGDRVVVAVSAGTFSGNVGCKDSKGNIYKVDGRSSNNSLFVCSSTIGIPLKSGDTITATYPGFSGVSTLIANEFSAVSNTDGTFKTGTSTSTKTVSAPNLTTTNPKDLIFGVVESKYQFIPGSGFQTAPSFNGLSAVYKIVESSGTFNTIGSVSTGSWISLLGAYK